MKEEAQKTLGDLYAIRATMSLIAQNDDGSEEPKKEISAREATLRQLQQSVEDEEKEREKEVEQYDLTILLHEAETKLEDVKKKHNMAKERMEEQDKKKKEAYESCRFTATNFFWECLDCLRWSLVGIYFGAYCGVAAVSAIFFFMMIGIEDLALALPLTLVLPFAYVIIAHSILALVRMHRSKVEYIKEYVKGIVTWYGGSGKSVYAKAKEEFDQSAAELEELETTVAQYRQKIENGDKYTHASEVDSICKKSQDMIDGYQATIEKTKAECVPYIDVVKSLALQSKALVDSAVKAYPVIDFRDWGNVDLLIYYYETGRADDMKEALQLVDRQRQTDQITSALAMASAEISRSIHQSMTRLGSALAQSFSVLSSQLAAQHSEMMQGMEEQAERQRAELGRQTALQASAQEMNAALLNKISVSSGRLAEQMDRQMKEVYNIY